MVKFTINLVPSLEPYKKTLANVTSSKPTTTTTTEQGTVKIENFFYDIIGISNTQPKSPHNDDAENSSNSIITDNTQNPSENAKPGTAQDPNDAEDTTVTEISRDDHLDDLGIQSNKKNVLNFTIDAGVFHSLEKITQKIIELEKKGFNAYFLNTMLNNKKAYLLRIGLFNNQKEALNIAFKLSKEGVKSEVLPMVQ